MLSLCQDLCSELNGEESQTGKNWRGVWGHPSLVLRSTEIQRDWSFKDLMQKNKSGFPGGSVARTQQVHCGEPWLGN